jgi:Ran GTPase-activating protein (RanGAP) involved in mRNA processing and transport
MIYVKENGISSVGATDIGSLLPSTQLTYFDMSGNYIGDECAAAIAHGILCSRRSTSGGSDT